jgi:hypothetical protein
MTLLQTVSSISFPVDQLPPPLDRLASFVANNNNIPDSWLVTACILLTVTIFVQLRAFARPPPVPLKRLPRRPALSILFKPDDIASSTTPTATATPKAAAPTDDGATTASDGSAVPGEETNSRFKSKPKSPWTNKLQTIFRSASKLHRADSASGIFNGSGAFTATETGNGNGNGRTGAATSSAAGMDQWSSVDMSFDSQQPDEDAQHQQAQDAAEPPVMHMNDLPDSFAPLLSSSQMEVLTNQLTADLIHAVQVSGGVRLRPGRHEMPLDKDPSRPQLIMDIPAGGCRVSAVAMVGSDGLTSDQDLDVTRKTTTRSKPMVKNLGLSLDPPLPLVNVAPTLIHFPTLFQDNFVPTLRRIQIIRLALDFVVSISSLLEKCLWILESVCQIHLSKVRVTPLYKGRRGTTKAKTATNTNTNTKQSQQVSQAQEIIPEWRLSLAFSGHVLLFGWIPIPFISVTLPTFIIPQPHALLEYLMTAQPLASAKLRPENIAQERIVLAAIAGVDSWNAQIKVVATPPAVGVDVTLPGGVTVAVELELGRDPGAGRNRATDASEKPPPAPDGNSGNSLSSWTTKPDNAGGVGGGGGGPTPTATAGTSYRRLSSTLVPPFDANTSVPWSLELSAKGLVSHEKMSVHILKLVARHEDAVGTIPVKSQFATRGSMAVWKVDPTAAGSSELGSAVALRRPHSFSHRRVNSFSRAALKAEDSDSPSVAAILLFPDETSSFHNDLRMVQYDYAFDVSEDTRVDAITLSVGANHPMLNGGTMVTTILDSIYAYGSLSAREDAVLDPIERRRKRNILRHLPCTDFTFGIQNIYIPQESSSYSDDGQTLFLPEVEGGRMMVRLLGGIQDTVANVGSFDKSGQSASAQGVLEGIKVVADFEIASLILQTEGAVKEFPELDIFEGVKFRQVLSGIIGGSIRAHLRPQNLTGPLSTTGPNIFNPLEAYEIDFARSSLSVKMKEYSASLGHRRIIFPAESTFVVTILESVVDMGFEGKTECELSWDCQGLSPILQICNVGESPEDAVPENKKQVSLLIAPLRQGRLTFRVSSVGGISVCKAATSREDKDGLYDWKFFNALVSPDEGSAERIIDVLHDKRTMDKLLQVIKFLNADLHKMFSYILRQVWRAKEIFDQEGVSDPGHAIPMYKMARLASLFLSGDSNQVDILLPIIRGAVAGEGIDAVKVKELLRQHLEVYDEWAPEIDRAVRWAAMLIGPMAAAQPYVEAEVVPLAELPYHAAKFQEIPSASELYDKLLDKPELPLDPGFSNLVSRVAPYLSFRQIEFFLQARAPTDWQPSDLRRIRYVYSIKRKSLQIAESYGGLSFLPQSFMVSVFLGEATRTSLRAPLGARKPRQRSSDMSMSTKQPIRKVPVLSGLRRRRLSNLGARLDNVTEAHDEESLFRTPAERVASLSNFADARRDKVPSNLVLQLDVVEQYELGDSLLGPQDVAILLQAGLTSVMKASTVVQLNQRMLLDLICSQPRSFAVAVLAEIGAPGGQGSPRSLTSALMSLLELDQTAFKPSHQLDLHALLESWIPGLKIPRREDYMAGGRWARQSYYEAIFAVANNILEDAETYLALKGHLQRVRKHVESDPLPRPREEPGVDLGLDFSESPTEESGGSATKLRQAIKFAKSLIKEADTIGCTVMEELLASEGLAKKSDGYESAIKLYRESFSACTKVLALDKHSFQSNWFREFYKRNYDALMIKSIYDNMMNNVDNVRHWLQALRNGSKRKEAGVVKKTGSLGESAWGGVESGATGTGSPVSASSSVLPPVTPARNGDSPVPDRLFLEPEESKEQILIDAIIDATIYGESDRELLRKDPLVRLLISNPPGHYNFVLVSAMGVITEGKKGLELRAAFERLEAERGVKAIRADTGTARSMEYNASKIQEAVEVATSLGTPYGLLGYSQGCANVLMAESMLLSGTPKQQRALTRPNEGLVCRLLMFSAANGSFHGPATEKKVQRLIVMCEEFFKYQQGYFSRALSSTVLESLNTMLDSAYFHKLMGGAQSFLQDGCRAFWREAQHLPHVPTCTLRGVMEEHTTPEALEMISHLLTKQSGSALHDSQVHVFDAVGHPVYHNNRNGRLLKQCAIGDASVQRTHHWSPLSDEVEIFRTPKDVEMASFDCAKDRHVFPWVDVNARFGFIKYATADKNNKDETKWMDEPERHPLSFVRGSPMEGKNDTAKKAEADTVVDTTNTLTPLRASVSPAQELFP